MTILSTTEKQSNSIKEVANELTNEIIIYKQWKIIASEEINLAPVELYSYRSMIHQIFLFPQCKATKNLANEEEQQNTNRKDTN